MKKALTVLALVLFIMPILPQRVLAYSDPVTESIADEADTDKLENEFLDEDELSGDKSINVFEKAFHIITSAFSENGNTLLRSFGMIMAMVILACVMGAMKFGSSESLDNVCGYISVLALSGVVYSVFYDLFVYVVASMESLTLMMSTLSPVMAALYVSGGSYAAGAASSSALSLFLTVLSVICTKILLPLLQIAFALCLVGAIPGSINLSSVTTLVKNTATTVMAFIFTLLGFTLYLQTTVASASDNFVTRSVKFASGVFVPVIGNMLGDASRTVIASVSVIKGSVGTVGIVMILSAVLPPLLIVMLYKLMLLVCSMCAKALSCERESALLYDIGSVLGVLMALVAGAGVICIIAMAVFIKTGVTV